MFAAPAAATREGLESGAAGPATSTGLSLQILAEQVAAASPSSLRPHHRRQQRRSTQPPAAWWSWLPSPATPLVGYFASGAVAWAWEADLAKLCAVSQHNSFVRLSAEAQYTCLSTSSDVDGNRDGAVAVTRSTFAALLHLYGRVVNSSTTTKMATATDGAAARGGEGKWRSAMWLLGDAERRDVTHPFADRFVQLANLGMANPAAFVAAQRLKKPAA